MAQTQNSLPVGSWFIGSVLYTNQYMAANTVTALPATALVNRRKLIIANDSGAAIWVQGSTSLGAAQGQGYEIGNGEERTFDIDANIVLYGISVAAAWVGCLEFA